MGGTVDVYRHAPIPSISVQVPQVYPTHSALEPISFLRALLRILRTLSVVPTFVADFRVIVF